MATRGSYGCVIKPSIPCKKYYQNTVSKLFHNELFYEEENIISDIIARIDPTNKFTLKKLDKCLVRKLPKKEMRECKYKSVEFPKSQIIYEYGGVDLTNLKEGSYNIKELLPAIYNLTIGLVELEKHRMCHRDIKHSNIVYKDGLFYFIDFGMSLSYDNVYDDDQDYVLKYNYCFYPPEFKVYYNYKFSQNSFTSINKIEQFIEKDVKLNYVKSEIVFDTNMIDGMIKALLDNVGSIDILKLAMIKQANKIDVFSLGVVLMDLLLKADDKFIETKKKLLSVLERCIELNPYKRINPKGLNDEIKKLL